MTRQQPRIQDQSSEMELLRRDSTKALHDVTVVHVKTLQPLYYEGKKSIVYHIHLTGTVYATHFCVRQAIEEVISRK